jgi:hypothetical protein
MITVIALTTNTNQLTVSQPSLPLQVIALPNIVKEYQVKGLGPVGPPGTSLITLDSSPINNLVITNEGLFSSPTWQTTDW